MKFPNKFEVLRKTCFLSVSALTNQTSIPFARLQSIRNYLFLHYSPRLIVVILSIGHGTCENELVCVCVCIRFKSNGSMHIIIEIKIVTTSHMPCFLGHSVTMGMIDPMVKVLRQSRGRDWRQANSKTQCLCVRACTCMEHRSVSLSMGIVSIVHVYGKFVLFILGRF